MVTVQSFRQAFPEFTSVVTYPDQMISVQLEISKVYLNQFYADDEATSDLVLQLMLAHVLTLRTLILDGQTEILISKLGNEGDVSVSLATPPSESTFYYWLSTSTYGLQLLSILEIKSCGGFYIGGSPEREPFRKFGGGF